MRFESSVTSVSWIPSEAVEGLTKLPFEMGMAHYDPPPPDVIDDLNALRIADRFRFANELRAWVDVEGGRIVGSGYSGGGQIGSTTMKLGPRNMTFAAVAFPDRRHDPRAGAEQVTFVQTAGGRTGVPAPRRVKYPPFVQVSAPLAWTTLSLTIHTDGHSEHELLGASPFPRHWIYDHDHKLSQKTGLIDFKTWFEKAFGSHTPWGDEDSPALVTEVESALERYLSSQIMRGGAAPSIKRLKIGQSLVVQGQPGSEMYVLLDGVLNVECDGTSLGHLGPGAVVGERALLESGSRTATLKAVTICRVAEVAAPDVEPSVLKELALQHRREIG